MSIFKCKMCGGDLDIQAGTSVAVCQYCGSKQTLPKLDNDKKMMLYDRANHFRRNSEFDKAMSIYEQILNEDNTDAEAYWSIVLCRYGIEYVEDPATHKRVPTVNRTQYTSIFDDEDYKSALHYADDAQKEIYENEAKTINEIQKGILAISQQEEPFDVFICYKETDSQGRRTADSVLANDLYYQLTQEGFKVFFSRITLEDKLGAAYEPYIFAALNSAKVMVVLGTKPEYFNAAWVKNEWSRYLALIKNGEKKILIPAYKDMDPYDLPEEFAHLQAQDMSKLGFMQDLIRGIKKITAVDEPKSVVKETIVKNEQIDVDALLRRGFMFLEDGDWNQAKVYFDKVLDTKPENAQAYLGKLLAENELPKESLLAELSVDLNEFSNYNKAVRYADHDLKNRLEQYNVQVKENIEKSQIEAARNTHSEIEKGKIKAFSSSNFAESFVFLSLGITISIMGVIAMYDYLTTKYVLPLIFLGIIPLAISLLACLLNKFDVQNPTDSEAVHYVLQKGQSIEVIDFHVNKKDKTINLIITLLPILFVTINMLIARAAAYDYADWSDWPEVCTWVISLATGIVIGLVLNIVENNKKLKKNDFYSIVQINILDDYNNFQEANKGLKKKFNKQFIKSILFAVVAIIIIIAVTIVFSLSISQIKYNAAVNAYESGNYEEAYNAFDELGGYKDSLEKQENMLFYIELEKLVNISVGDILEFGDKSWNVLAVENNKALIILTNSEWSLENVDYTDNYRLEDSWKWKTSAIRTELNDDFYNGFGNIHKEFIVQTNVYDDDGSYTQDYVFILSHSEVEKYFSSNEDRRFSDGDTWYVSWWLRPTSDDNAYYYINDLGEFEYDEDPYIYGEYAIRPAMWIDLSKIVTSQQSN